MEKGGGSTQDDGLSREESATHPLHEGPKVHEMQRVAYVTRMPKRVKSSAEVVEASNFKEKEVSMCVEPPRGKADVVSDFLRKESSTRDELP
ncbi:hypothetical protein V6N12_045462 [Hibiscus sabdariffa]|uniref:Uncharacterized protein n=1 Tax=Hibiscus sabdariffa TaxID=183260 RepID=A0ABR2G3J9_9ROSI